MQTQETETITTLTHAQFIAARTLASEHYHRWAEVPDGTYNIEDIKTYSLETANPDLPAGIISPDLYKKDGVYYVNHITGTGRLYWEISQYGKVRLEVYRPGKHGDKAILVAAIDIMNGQNDEDENTYEVGDVYISTADYAKCHDNRGNVLPRWTYVNKEDINEEILFERHVNVLASALCALLAAGKEPAGTEWQLAKDILAPLYEIALPDPSNEDDGEKTYWYWLEEKKPEICHRGETFPLETERAAVHTILLLQKQPEMQLIDAVKAAIRSASYRPEE